jgi:hypothetical protein
MSRIVTVKEMYLAFNVRNYSLKSRYLTENGFWKAAKG